MLLSEIISLINPASGKFPSADRDIEYLLTDSRSLDEPGKSMFFAIPGIVNDGHYYLNQLYEAGVRAFVVNEVPEDIHDMNEAAFLVVEDSVAALQKVASHHPDFKGEILAITGSRGKTTLKEWIFQLLESSVNIARSPRSYNSRVGVPLSLWQIKPATQLAIIEAGISRYGEMKPLAECIKPDTVIITNIGSPHAEGFKSDTEKAEQKVLLASTPATDLIIFSADYPPIANAVRKSAPDTKTLTWSSKGNKADIQIEFIPVDDKSMTVKYYSAGIESSFVAPFENEVDCENGANALAFMLHRGIDRNIIADSFSRLHKIGTRLNVSEGMNGCSIIFDQYTSDFSSLLPALDFMRRRRTPAQSSTLILSDLNHEDIPTETICRKLSRMVKEHDLDRFIGVGPALKSFQNLFPKDSLFFNSTADLLANLSPADFFDEIVLIKGAPEFNLATVAEMLEARKHETVLEVNLDAIISNYNYFRNLLSPGVGMMCMVKASGYGAGSYEIAKTLQDCGAAYLAVAVLDEGIELRKRGITMPIIVLNPKASDYKALFENKLEPNIYSFELLETVAARAEKHNCNRYPVHIKLDTGMHRMGFTESEIPALMNRIADLKQIKIQSVFSHLATADCPDMDDYTLRQLTLFENLTSYMSEKYPTHFLKHILNSAGIIRFPEFHYDMVRLGIGLYGANTLPPEMEKPLTPVSTLRTVIIAVREWKKGETIGYGRRGILNRDSRIATIPIGYADGMNRQFGLGKISVFINGKFAPTVGNICMDACMIDVTDIDCKVGDAVEIFGKNAPLSRLADTLGTIPYEILTSVSPRVKRIYYRE